MNRFLTAMTITLAILLAAPCVRESRAADADGKQIVFSGKVYCSLKRPVVVLFDGIISKVLARNGDPVKENQVLARYALQPRVLFDLKRRLRHMEIVDRDRRLEELDAERDKVKKELARLKEMVKEGVVPKIKTETLEEQLRLNAERREFVESRKSLDVEIAREEDSLLAKELGTPIKNGKPPEEALLKAPIGGHVVWVNSVLREQAELNRGTHVITVGVMDPMILIAHVHEIEAIHLKVGDAATFEPESLRDKRYQATVNRISWSTLTPQQDKPSYYEVEFIVRNPDFTLKEGFRGRVTMEK